MDQELTSRLRQEVRRRVDQGLSSLEALGMQADLSVTTLRRFLQDGELSTSATMRLAGAIGLVQRFSVSSAEGARQDAASTR